jgi:phosphoethanolamine N-methyltransferase
MINSLDLGQYSKAEIEKYEAVYGRNFISPGGLATAQEFTALLGLKAGMTVLDVGCGVGGSAFYIMAQHDGAWVHGIDLSTNMIAFANERCREAHLNDRVTFANADILTFTPQSPFDCVYSRDVFLHIHDKARLMQILKTCLKPNGRLVFTDYACNTGDKSPAFAAYIQQRKYNLYTVTAYQQLLLDTGFVDVIAEDRTAQFIQILERELAAMPSDRFDTATLTSLRHSWQDKITRTKQGEQRWGLFQARCPS